MATERKKDKAADASVNKAATAPAKTDNAKDRAGRTKDDPSQNASTNTTGELKVTSEAVGENFIVTEQLEGGGWKQSLEETNPNADKSTAK